MNSADFCFTNVEIHCHLIHHLINLIPTDYYYRHILFDVKMQLMLLNTHQYMLRFNCLFLFNKLFMSTKLKHESYEIKLPRN